MLFFISTHHMSVYLSALLFQRTRVLGSEEAGHGGYEEVRAMCHGFLAVYKKKNCPSTYTLQSEFPHENSLVKKVLLHKFGHEDRETLLLIFNLCHGKSQKQKQNGSVNPHVPIIQLQQLSTPYHSCFIYTIIIPPLYAPQDYFAVNPRCDIPLSVNISIGISKNFYKKHNHIMPC